MNKLTQTFGRVEAHIRALAAAAAQAQLATSNVQPDTHGWSGRYDALARNLAEPALEELAALRSLLGVLRPCASPASRDMQDANNRTNRTLGHPGCPFEGALTGGSGVK